MLWCSLQPQVGKCLDILRVVQSSLSLQESLYIAWTELGSWGGNLQKLVTFLGDYLKGLSGMSALKSKLQRPHAQFYLLCQFSLTSELIQSDQTRFTKVRFYCILVFWECLIQAFCSKQLKGISCHKSNIQNQARHPWRICIRTNFVRFIFRKVTASNEVKEALVYTDL